MNIAIIPARGGSKRIPRKNLKLFHGLPVISYAIQAAIESESFDEIFVSTDDEEIAKIAMFYGATIPWLRSKELSGDYATTLSVMQDSVNRLKSDLANIDNVCCIYPVTPLLKPIYISKGLEILKSGKWDYVFSALPTSSPHRFFSLGSSKGVEMLFSDFALTRTQDLPFTYCDAGQFYWGKKSSWESALPILSAKSTVLELPTDSVVDIDTVTDWSRAEQMFDFQKYKKNEN
jgi:pseudaminic acid cytidylyltransferase